MSDIIERIDQTTIYTQPVFFFLILFANTLNIYILCSHTLRSSPCTYYFIVYSINAITHACFLCPLQILRRYSIIWKYTSIGCKLQDFILFTLTLQAGTMLLLASFDRFCCSSSSVRFRSISSLRTAKLTIGCCVLLIVLYMLPLIIIYHYDSTMNVCSVYLNSVTSFYISSQIVFYYICIPLFLIIFGMLTIINIRQQSKRVVPIATVTHRRRTEGQLVRMLLLQILIYLIFSLPYGITYTMTAFAPSTRTLIVLAIRQAAVTWLQPNYFLSFFLYTASASIYRQQLIQILRRIKYCA